MSGNSAHSALGDGSIVSVTFETFAALVTGTDGPVVVEFMSYGCGHCRLLEPILKETAAKLESEVRFLRVNTATEPKLAVDYGIVATPTLVMFSQGAELGRLEGPEPSLSSLLSAIRRFFEL